jgi:DNA invertase Pin-like site-specific DNA recombinase
MPHWPPDTAVFERRDLAKAPYLIGYARVSKGDAQSNVAQRRALDAAGCKRVFEETASGGRWDRPKLQEMIEQLRDGDVVVVWKLDRLSRSLKDLLHIMDRIETAGSGFRSLTEAIDTTTAAGRMMMQMVGSFAEFERAMIRERTSAGLARRVPKGGSADAGASSAKSNGARLRSPSSPDENPAPRWRGSIMSASRPFRASSPRTD